MCCHRYRISPDVVTTRHRAYVGVIHPTVVIYWSCNILLQVRHYSGFPLNWIPSILDSLYTGLPLYWIPSILDSLYTGLPLYWIPSILDSLCTGFPLYWNPSILDSL